MTIKDWRNKLEQQKGKQSQVTNNIANLNKEIHTQQRELRNHEEAREIIREVGLATQQQLQFHISNLTSLALEAVFDNPYELLVEFIQRRNKTECDLLFSRNDSKMKPLESSGFGAVDVASFALRVASWSMQTPHSRAVLILDEPFKHLKGNKANLRVLDMVHEISKKLNLQIIMVSDERVDTEDIVEHADRVFKVGIRKGESYIITL
jgi:DNA repair exonuclease SbcCD ATPase subunit